MADISLFGSKLRPLVGLDISSSSVKLVELTSSDRGGLRLERYVIEPLPSDSVVDGIIAKPDAVTDCLRRALRRFGSGTKNAAIALPLSSVFSKKIILPAGLRDLDMEIQVESEAAQVIPFSLDEVNLDFQVIGPAGNPDEVEVMVVAARKEQIEDRVSVAESCGLKVMVVDVDALAGEAAFELVVRQLPESTSDKMLALVDIGAVATNFAVLRNGQRVYMREQSFGGQQLTKDISRQYGMSMDEAEAAKRSNSLPDDYAFEVLHPFIENLALEVSRAMQFFFTSTQYNEVDYLVLAGGCATMPSLADAVSKRAQVKTGIANPFVGMSMPAKLGSGKLLADAPSLMVACGLAMRRFDK